MESDAEPLAQRGLAPGPTVRVTVGLDDGAHGSAFGHAAPDPEAHAAAGEHVHHGEVLGQPQRMPHRRDVEATAHLQPLGLVCEVEGQHQNVRDALVALALEMVLGEPERVVPAAVEQARQIARLGVGGDEALVRKHAAVHGGAAVADVVHVQVAGVQAVELGDHGPPSTPPYHIRAGPVASVSARSATPSAHAAGPTWEGWGKACGYSNSFR